MLQDRERQGASGLLIESFNPEPPVSITEIPEKTAASALPLTKTAVFRQTPRYPVGTTFPHLATAKRGFGSML